MNYVIYQSEIDRAIAETNYGTRYGCGIGVIQWVTDQSIRTSAYYDCIKRENPTSNMMDAFRTTWNELIIDTLISPLQAQREKYYKFKMFCLECASIINAFIIGNHGMCLGYEESGFPCDYEESELPNDRILLSAEYCSKLSGKKMNNGELQDYLASSDAMKDAFREMVRRSILWEYGKVNL